MKLTMGILVTIFVAGMLLSMRPVAAPGVTYTQALDVYLVSTGGTISWSHTYDGSADPIATATLTIVADDVDGPGNGMDGEQDNVYFNGHLLGLLNDIGYYTNWGVSPGPGNPNQPLTTTTFNLDPSWISPSMPTVVEVETGWEVEIETSTLTVFPIVQVIPEVPLGTIMSAVAMIFAFVAYMGTKNTHIFRRP